MSRGPIPISDKITVLVFKDNFASRTFHIPLSWISRFGILVAALMVLALTSSIAAIKYYRISAKTDPTRVQDLELELGELKSHLKRIESRDPLIASQTASVNKAAPPAPAQTGSGSPSQETSKTIEGSSFALFATWPSNLEAQVPDPATLSFTIQPPKTSWSGKTLRVHFALQYTKEDQGSQQGRILVLARGPGHLLSYPDRLFNPSSSETLIHPERGEHFSVSRYREVKAEFGPVPSQSSLQEIEILIFDRENHLLIQQIVSLPKPKVSQKVTKEKTEDLTHEESASPGDSPSASTPSSPEENPSQ
jgi:hypothetical protein